MSPNTTRNYSVSGMSCGHCETSVREEVGEITGVEEISVDLESGVLTISGAGFSDDAVRSAVADAGYEVVA
jgi:copper chaperone